MTNTIDLTRAERRWLVAALAIALFYSLLALRLAFHAPNLVQDDARQHVFWMQRFIDPTLFPNDLIADYFQAVAPAGYKAIYWIFAKLGVEPLLLSKLLPAAIGLITAYVAFRLFLQLIADARGAFLASVFLSQLIWLKDDVISATPRAFVYPLFLAFLFFLLRQRLFPCLLIIALTGLIYPQAALVSAAVLILLLIKWPKLSRDSRDYLFCAAGLLVLTAVLLPFASSVSHYGPVITRDEARLLPEFLEHGRAKFFVAGFEFWFTGARSGLFPTAIPWHFVALAMAAPVLFVLPRKSPLLRHVKNGGVLLRLALAAIALWATAHALLFKLHLPARYSQWVFRILIAMAAAMALAAIWEAVERWRKQLERTHQYGKARSISALFLIIALYLIAFPHFATEFPHHSYLQAEPASLYEFLRTQPKDGVIATLRKQGSMIPVFAQRSVLVSAEHAIPYHQAYYRTIRQRGQDLVRANFTRQPKDLLSFIQRNSVDLIIVGRTPATPQYVKKLRWFGEITPVKEIVPPARPEERPVLWTLVERSKVWEDKTIIVLDARLIAQTIQPNETSTPP